MEAEPNIVAEHREELIALLSEAAEIEHGLMCCYLYAAFSLKTSDDSGLSPFQLAATRDWRAAILDVAIEEMMHLGLVANLMSAVGARPNFSRQNFPVSSGYHPAGVVVELMRFCRASLDHFVYLERPEGLDLPDGEGFRAQRPYARTMDRGALLPSAQDYLTVGHLYRSLEAGFENLAAKLGEAALFIGAPAAQMSPETSGFPKLTRVTDLKSAKAAIEAIIEQGEGAPGHSDEGHYAKFCKVRDAFVALSIADPSFDPAWPAAHNPVLRPPVAPEGRVHVTNPEARRLLDVANSGYGLMLRCLMAAFGQSDATPASQRLFYGAAIDLMHAVTPLAERLCRVAAQDGAGSPNAGLTFTLPRSVTPLATTGLALHVAAERANELAQACAAHSAEAPALLSAQAGFAGVARALGAFKPTAATPATEPAPPQAEASGPAPAIDEAVGTALTIRFDTKRCIHSRFCVLQAPGVFKANTPGKWLYPDAMDVEKLVAVAELCPSGAVTYQRRDGKPNEAPPPVNVAKLRENGPYAVSAAISLDGRAMTRATLCRCGASKNKPFCDGSHNSVAFAATGEPATRPSEPLSPRDGALTIAPQPDGPLAVSGPLEICAGTGRTIDRVTSARLCRCGGSANKPFCDGTHVRIGFRSGV